MWIEFESVVGRVVLVDPSSICFVEEFAEGVSMITTHSGVERVVKGDAGGVAEKIKSALIEDSDF